ncbi:hypothetical protein M422DRAFT_253436 [Sphaerobolus stellatus SS14]|uniref:Uncharacterized protein n=1 Tax=Sphaerobolus stellatus (strain SS14) TaxID=990650 RepID=A0A0C9VWN4_SPHS4|nr:hypothetical protein M422DRAFT_253436 [Sphaerobolus stellatus SS14]
MNLGDEFDVDHLPAKKPKSPYVNKDKKPGTNHPKNKCMNAGNLVAEAAGNREVTQVEKPGRKRKKVANKSRDEVGRVNDDPVETNNIPKLSQWQKYNDNVQPIADNLQVVHIWQKGNHDNAVITRALYWSWNLHNEVSSALHHLGAKPT